MTGTTIEGRERYMVQVRYARDRRDDIDRLGRILVTSREGAQVPLEQLAAIRYVRGPQVIKAEDTFLTGYVTFGSRPGYAEVDVVEAARAYLAGKEASAELLRPPGIRYDFELFGQNIGELFNVAPINLSTAIWVGFLALFGITTDDGVVISTYLRQRFAALKPSTVPEIRQATLEAGLRRVRPCLMTAATTLLALLPVITSTGRGADLMVPMAIPIFGGMFIQLMTMFIVPTLYSLWKERALTRTPAGNRGRSQA
jgi:Cu/Ag efflux pump CusA